MRGNRSQRIICLAHIVSKLLSEGIREEFLQEIKVHFLQMSVWTLSVSFLKSCLSREVEAAATSSTGKNNFRLTRHAEVFGLLGLVTTLGAGWSFAFLLFEDLTLGVVITVTGLRGHR